MKILLIGLLLSVMTTSVLAFTFYRPTKAGVTLEQLAGHKKPQGVDEFSMARAIVLLNPKALLPGDKELFRVGQRLRLPVTAQEVITVLESDGEISDGTLKESKKDAGEIAQKEIENQATLTSKIEAHKEEVKMLQTKFEAVQSNLQNVEEKFSVAQQKLSDKTNAELFLQKQVAQLSAQKSNALWAWVWFVCFALLLALMFICRFAPNCRSVVLCRQLVDKHAWKNRVFKAKSTVKDQAKKMRKSLNKNTPESRGEHEQTDLLSDDVSADRVKGDALVRGNAGEAMQADNQVEQMNNGKSGSDVESFGEVKPVASTKKDTVTCLPHQHREDQQNVEADKSAKKVDPQEAVLREYIKESPKALTHHKALLDYFAEQDSQEAFDRHMKKMVTKKVIKEGSPEWHQLRTQYLDKWVYG